MYCPVKEGVAESKEGCGGRKGKTDLWSPPAMTLTNRWRHFTNPYLGVDGSFSLTHDLLPLVNGRKDCFFMMFCSVSLNWASSVNLCHMIFTFSAFFFQLFCFASSRRESRF